MLYEVITVPTNPATRNCIRNESCAGKTSEPARHGTAITRRNEPGVGTVITSYSIHYTKLYELGGEKCLIAFQ